MSIPARLAPRIRHALTPLVPVPSSSRGFMSTGKVAKEEWPQRTPLGLFYESLLKAPPLIPEVKPEDPPNSADPEVLPPGKEPVPTETPAAEKKPKRKPGRPRKTETTKADNASADSAFKTSTQDPPKMPEPTPQERAAIIFGSRLLGPAEQADKLQAKQAQSRYIAGVLVPPKPEEPDNCCMSGCVDCVWERYREELEEWSLANQAAQRRLRAGEVEGTTMDADGGGSETNWGPTVGETKIAKDLWDEGIFEDIPVGIREFMKQEKRLKQRHQREGTSGG